MSRSTPKRLSLASCSWLILIHHTMSIHTSVSYCSILILLPTLSWTCTCRYWYLVKSPPGGGAWSERRSCSAATWVRQPDALCPLWGPFYLNRYPVTGRVTKWSLLSATLLFQVSKSRFISSCFSLNWCFQSPFRFNASVNLFVCQTIFGRICTVPRYTSIILPISLILVYGMRYQIRRIFSPRHIVIHGIEIKVLLGHDGSRTQWKEGQYSSF